MAPQPFSHQPARLRFASGRRQQARPFFLSLANSLLGSLTVRAIRNSRFHCPVAPCLAPGAASMTTAALAAFTATVALAASRAWGAASGFLAKNEFAQHIDKAGGDDEADDDLLCHPKILDAI